MRRVALLALCALPMVTVPLAAQSGVEIAPFVGYRVGGSLENSQTRATYGIKEALSYGASLEAGREASRIWLLYSRQETDIDTLGATVPITLQEFMVGGSRDMTAKGTARPFVVGSLGLTSASTNGGRSISKFALGAGLGLKTPPNSRLVLRGEVRGFATFVGDQAAVGSCGGAGCAIAFTSSVLFQGEFVLGAGIRF